MDQTLTYGTVVQLPHADGAIPARWLFHVDDPSAVVLSVHNGSRWVDWTLSRELLAAGLAMPAGDGDVHLEPFPSGDLLVQLDNGQSGGRAVLLTHGETARRFLDLSYQLVPLGAERLDWEVETALFDLLT